MATKRLLRLPAVKDKTGETTTNIYTAMKAGTFPKSVPLGPRRVAWVEAEIDEWIEARIAARGDRTENKGGPGRGRRGAQQPQAVAA